MKRVIIFLMVLATLQGAFASLECYSEKPLIDGSHVMDCGFNESAEMIKNYSCVGNVFDNSSNLLAVNPYEPFVNDKTGEIITDTFDTFNNHVKIVFDTDIMDNNRSYTLNVRCADVNGTIEDYNLTRYFIYDNATTSKIADKIIYIKDNAPYVSFVIIVVFLLLTIVGLLLWTWKK